MSKINLDWMDLQKSNPSDWKEVVKRLAGYIRPYWTYPTQSVEMITEDILVMIQNHQWERYRPVKILSNILQELHLMQQ